MTERSDLLESIAKTIADYRLGQIARPTSSHVGRWIGQFDGSVQVPILREMDHVLRRTYLSRNAFQSFLSGVVVDEKLTGGNPQSFWDSVHVLNIQHGGNSQRDMRRMLSATLENEHGWTLPDREATSDEFVYLDDGIFTGNRLRQDLNSWIESAAPKDAVLHVVVIGLHRGGQYYAKSTLANTCRSSGKTIDIKWWPSVELEDRKFYTNSSDVLRPTCMPDEQAVIDYACGLSYKPVLRELGSPSAYRFFTSEKGRHVLEQELLKAGVRIRSICANLNEYQRPLGYSRLVMLGFGSLLVTFRNCPNNAPLALWVGDPWYPLFPRRPN